MGSWGAEIKELVQPNRCPDGVKHDGVIWWAAAVVHSIISKDKSKQKIRQYMYGDLCLHGIRLYNIFCCWAAFEVQVRMVLPKFASDVKAMKRLVAHVPLPKAKAKVKAKAKASAIFEWADKELYLYFSYIYNNVLFLVCFIHM